MWWIATWAVLLVGGFVVTARLCWRIFVMAKATVSSLGDVSHQIGQAQAAAAQTQARWLELRAQQDDEYRAVLTERARPAPAGLTLPRTMLDDSKTSAPRGSDRERH